MTRTGTKAIVLAAACLLFTGSAQAETMKEAIDHCVSINAAKIKKTIEVQAFHLKEGRIGPNEERDIRDTIASLTRKNQVEAPTSLYQCRTVTGLIDIAIQRFKEMAGTPGDGPSGLQKCIDANLAETNALVALWQDGVKRGRATPYYGYWNPEKLKLDNMQAKLAQPKPGDAAMQAGLKSRECDDISKQIAAMKSNLTKWLK